LNFSEQAFSERAYTERTYGGRAYGGRAVEAARAPSEARGSYSSRAAVAARLRRD
jgi:hypothetical protein